MGVSRSVYLFSCLWMDDYFQFVSIWFVVTFVNKATMDTLNKSFFLIDIYFHLFWINI